MKIMKKKSFFCNYDDLVEFWLKSCGDFIYAEFFLLVFYQIHITQALARISMQMLEIHREKNVLLWKLNSTLFSKIKLKHIFIVGSFQGILMNVWYDNGFHDGDILWFSRNYNFPWAARVLLFFISGIFHATRLSEHAHRALNQKIFFYFENYPCFNTMMLSEIPSNSVGCGAEPKKWMNHFNFTVSITIFSYADSTDHRWRNYGDARTVRYQFTINSIGRWQERPSRNLKFKILPLKITKVKHEFTLIAVVCCSSLTQVICYALLPMRSTINSA